MRVLSWNLFHGRDSPPNPALFSWRSRLFRIPETDGTYVQVNRPLLPEFERVLSSLEWDFALLQEAPPRWYPRFVEDLRVGGAITLTSRNSLHRLRGLLAELNPDLMASGEGGSNQLLVRPPWRVAEVREHTVAERPERRRMLWARLEGGDAPLAVANLHGSVDTVRAGPRQIVAAAERAAEWADGLPLVFGGDLNLRPAREPEVFAELEERFGLAPPTAPDVVDHILASGLDVLEHPHLLPSGAREVTSADGLRVRLSDHACVVAALGMR